MRDEGFTGPFFALTSGRESRKPGAGLAIRDAMAYAASLDCFCTSQRVGAIVG
jgi:hypothetical protein